MKKIIQKIKSTKRKISKIIKKIKFRFRRWYYDKLCLWFKQNKNNKFFVFFENASWFPWYGKKVIHVKSKSDNRLTSTEYELKSAIHCKDYQRALTILNSIPETPKNIALKQMLNAKVDK